MPTFIKNAYGENAVTNSSLSRDMQRRFDAGEFSADVEPQEQPSYIEGVGARLKEGQGVVTSLGSEFLGRTITPDTPDKGFWRKVGEDAAVLGVGIPIFIEQVLTNPVKTLKETPGALVQSVKDMVNPDYYKAHPALGVVNLVGNVSIVGGIAKAAIMGTVKSSALKVAVDAAEQAGIKTALRTPAAIGKFSRYNVSEKAIVNAVVESAKTGNLGHVSETVTALMTKGGASPEVAAKIASDVSASVAQTLSQQKTRLNLIDPIAHPMRATGNLLRKTSDPISTLVFGKPANTAVGVLYGADRVAKDPAGFVAIEKWAGAQVEERGIAQTAANRQRVMMEWTESNPQWAYLSAEERVKHFQNYARNDLIRKQIHDQTGMDIVTTKSLPPQFVDAMVDTVKSQGDNYTPKAILDELEEVYGNDVAIHRGEIEAVLAKSNTVEALVGAIEALGKARSLVSFERFSPGIQTLAEELIGSGYRIGRAPTNKKVSYATDLEVAGLPEKLAQRTWIGNWIDKFGLSTRGTVEGAVEYFYRENFTQSVLKNLPEKYGNKVKIGNVTIPFENLYSFLDRKKFTIGEGRSKLDFSPYTVFDLKKADYKRIGLADDLAADLEKIGKQSLADVPVSQIGVGDKVVNFLRTRNKGFGEWMSNVFDKYLKVAYAGRYNINPFFAAQQYVETVSMSGLLFKDPVGALSVPWGRLGTWTAEKMGKKITEMTFLKDIVNPAELPLKEVKLVTDELMYNLSKEMQNFGMSEVRTLDRAARGSKVKPGLDTIEGRAALEQSITSNNFWLKAVGYSHARAMTVMNKGLAKKFGMSLEEALAFTIDENGKKVYKNPQMLQMMKELTQSAVHYEPGFLTSPLVKTLNLVWFPFRFSAKTASVTAKWLGTLPPVQRTAVLTNWMYFANWATTEEGKKWRKGQRSILGNLIQYAFAFEQLGKSADAVARGELFGGNTGLIGGVPFGALVNIATQLGYFPEDPEQYNPVTLRRFEKKIPRDPASVAALSVAIENMLISIMPSMPFYTLTGGAVKFSVGGSVREIVRGVMGAAQSQSRGEDLDFSKGKARLEREFIQVPQNYNRFSP